ncbi:hypothetical protein MAA5396_04769 [Marinovum algicola]|uniref:Transcriptional regulator, AlpA family n=1 Tax=Marinovum algicola TaxID=42444 RepID=A0A975WEN6_9RHOB|nr:DNA-binding protein [Marinovum algicola]SEK08199.1 transcriptional regulator, AlpA family [Marinovum algicola]SLN76600.1 hypothetical protein MAA5396_04769 [Marinovum algicola]
MANTDPLICDKDGAKMIGGSVSTFWRRVADGTIPKPIKIGGMSRWRQSWIEQVIQKAEAAREAA